MSNNSVQNMSLPKGWRKIKLGDVSKFSKGNGITKDEVIAEGVPCVRYGELYTKHHFKINDFYSFISDKNPGKYKLIKNNDLLFAGSGETREEIGKCASFNHSTAAYAGGDVIVCSIDPKVLCADIASYYLNTIGRRQLNKLGQGDSIVHIYSRYLENVEILVPPLPEQKAIASLIQTWDTAIEKMEDLIIARQKRFEWLRTRLTIPQNHWKSSIIQNSFELGRGRVISKKYMEEHSGKYPVFSSQTSNNGELGKVATYDFEGDYLTWTTDGANAGAVFFRTGKFNCTNVCGTAKAKDEHELSAEFISYYLQGKTKKYVSYVGNPKLMNNVFASIPIHFPSLTEQKSIIITLNTAQREILLSELLSKQYRIQKRGLMHKLLTGKLKVNT